MDNAVALADVIWQLRAELTRAALGGENEELRFKAEKVELELTVGVERSSDPRAKVNFWVFEAGTSAHSKGTSSQTVRLTLTPVFRGSPDQAAFITGESVNDEK